MDIEEQRFKDSENNSRPKIEIKSRMETSLKIRNLIHFTIHWDKTIPQQKKQ